MQDAGLFLSYSAGVPGCAMTEGVLQTATPPVACGDSPLREGA